MLPLIWQLDACPFWICTAKGRQSAELTSKACMLGVPGCGPDLAENRTPTMLVAPLGRANEKGAISV